MVALGSVCKLVGGATPSKANENYWINGTVKWISSRHLDDLGNVTGSDFITESAVAETSTGIAPAGAVILITRVSVGKFAFATEQYAINQDLTAVIPKDQTVLSSRFLFCIARQLATVIEANAQGIGVRGVTRAFVGDLQIPLPPLEVQNQIVAEIEGYQKIIDGARKVLDNYKPRILVSPNWPVATVGDAASIRSGGTPDRSNDSYWGGNIPWIKTGQIDFNVIDSADEFITQAGMENSAARLFPTGTILMAMYGQGVTRGRVAILGIEATTNQACAAIEVTSESMDRDFLYRTLEGKYEELRAISESRGGNQSNLNAQLIREVKIPFPDLATQRAIVAEIEAEQTLVNANRELIRRMEAKVKAAIDRVWGN
jgi:restriction endonuclease S subunit